MAERLRKLADCKVVGHFEAKFSVEGSHFALISIRVDNKLIFELKINCN